MKEPSYFHNTYNNYIGIECWYLLFIITIDVVNSWDLIYGLKKM